MLDLSLEDLELRRILSSRAASRDRVALALNGALEFISGDASALLTYVSQTFPSYTTHSIQHSWRIVERVSSVLSDKAKEQLSSVEIFSFIIAAAFHDTGMASDDKTEPGIVRNTHHSRGRILLERYMAERLQLMSDYISRLAPAIGFVVEAHNLDWETMVSRDEFQRSEKVMGQVLRPNVLAILLRIGDLLDLDAERSCDVITRYLPGFFINNDSLLHHNRHKKVIHFDYNNNIISIEAEASSKDEYQIWSTWLESYLKRDILHANTYVFRDSLEAFKLPMPNIKIKKSKGATYELWPLRFEIDDSGRIWDIISRSVYTGKFDFIRELVQNAIDAELLQIYENKDVECASPRGWSQDFNSGGVLVIYSHSRHSIHVMDNGVGMNKQILQSFLFKVAETGFTRTLQNRSHPFPSIAKFGIGFVSVLPRAARVTLETMRYDHSEPGRRVNLQAFGREAYVEQIHSSFQGTKICIKLRDDLKDSISRREIRNYLQKTIKYPSRPVLYIDLDQLRINLENLRPSGLYSEDYDILSKLASLDDSTGAGTNVIGQTLDVRKIHDLIGRMENSTNSKDTAKNKKVKRSSQGISLFLHNPRFAASLPAEAQFLYLNESLMTVKILPQKSVSIVRKGIVIIWIPVTHVDYKMGIEWQSMHGFLVKDSELKRTVMLGQRTVRNIDDYIDGDDDGMDLYDEDDEYLDSVEEMRRMQEGHNIRLKMEYHETDILALAPDDVMVSRGAALQDDDDNDVLQSAPYESYFGGSSYLLSMPLESTDQPSSTLQEDFHQISTQLARLDNSVFQDGIRLPLQARSIAPLGACRARVNLTARARLYLNVSRNSIDEAPGFLSGWAKEVGRIIQEVVYTKVTHALKSIKIEPTYELLLSPRSSAAEHDPLIKYTSEILKTLVK